jgi:hypothetical protein
MNAMVGSTTNIPKYPLDGCARVHTKADLVHGVCEVWSCQCQVMKST